MTRRRSTGILLLALVVVIAGAMTRIHRTDAAWTDVDHLSAPVSSGYWPTSGNARAEVGRVSSINFTVGLLSGGNALPWAGPTAVATQASPGAVSASGAGPYVTGGVLSLVNQFTAGSSTGSSIGGSVCASYSWGPSSPSQCASAPQKVHATGTLSSYRLSTNLLLGIGTVDALTVPSPISATATCNLSAPAAVNTATRAAAGNAATGNQGTVQVKGNAVSIPAAGGTTTFSFPQGGLVNAAVSGSLTSTVEQAATSARSTLVMDARVLRLDIVGQILLDFTFRAVLVDVSCGTSGSAPTAVSAGAVSAARVAAPAQPVDPTDDPTSSESSTATTTVVPTTTTVPTSSAATTTNVAPITATADVVPDTTTAATTTSPTTTTTTTEPASTSTSPPTSVPDSPVTGFETVDGRSCTADTDAPTSFSCDDGSVLTFGADELTTPTIVDGVWVPTTIDGVSVPVVSVTRG